MQGLLILRLGNRLNIDRIPTCDRVTCEDGCLLHILGDGEVLGEQIEQKTDTVCPVDGECRVF